MSLQVPLVLLRGVQEVSAEGGEIRLQITPEAPGGRTLALGMAADPTPTARDAASYGKTGAVWGARTLALPRETSN